MYRIIKHKVSLGENFIFLPENTEVKDVKLIDGKAHIITCEPVIWGTSKRHRFSVEESHIMMKDNQEYIGTVILPSETGGFEEVRVVYMDKLKRDHR